MNMLGKVKTYREDRGFGFCASEGRSVFFHVSDFEDRRIPKVNDVIEFDLGIDPKSRRMKAMHIRILTPEYEYEQKEINQ